MIVSFRHKFIFIAIPKTATHAFRVALRPSLAASDWEQCRLFEKKSFPVETLAQIGHGHLSYWQIEPFLLPQMRRDFFKFCTVRNPYDRFVSYCYFVNRENNSMQKDPLGTMKKVIQEKESAKEILFRPQFEFVIGENGSLITDYVCKFETLQADFDDVCRQLNLPSAKLPRINAINHAPSENVYDEELKKSVRDFYQQDFRLFDYSTEFETISET